MAPDLFLGMVSVNWLDICLLLWIWPCSFIYSLGNCSMGANHMSDTGLGSGDPVEIDTNNASDVIKLAFPLQHKWMNNGIIVDFVTSSEEKQNDVIDTSYGRYYKYGGCRRHLKKMTFELRTEKMRWSWPCPGMGKAWLSCTKSPVYDSSDKRMR